MHPGSASPLPLLLALPWLLAAVLALTSRRLARAMAPRSSLRLLPVAAVAVAGACGFSLSVLAMLLLSHAAAIAELGRWWAPALPGTHVPWALGLPVAAVVTALLGSALLHAARVVRQLWLAQATCGELEPATTDGSGRIGCTVVAAPEPDAFAVPGLRGRIVVSSGMLAALDGPQQQALLAHERSHLAHRHHLWIQATEVAAAANPLLRGLPALVRAATEREADLDAADAVGDREVTAQAIAAAALARARYRRSATPRPVGTHLAVTGGDVVDRVRQLRCPRPGPGARGRRPAAGLLVALITAAVLVSAASADITEDHYDHALLVARWARLSAAAGAQASHLPDTLAPLPSRS